MSEENKKLSKKKKILVRVAMLCCCVVVLGLVVDNASKPKPPTLDQIKNIELKKEQAKHSLKKCAESVDFQIGAVKYRIDPKYRVSFFWRDMNGNEYRNVDARYVKRGCPNIDLGEISYFLTSGEGGLTILSAKTKFETLYDRYKDKIEKSRNNKSIIKLSSGIEKISLKHDELYVLPLDSASTGNGEPVIFLCDKPDKNRDWPEKYFLERCGVAVCL